MKINICFYQKRINKLWSELKVRKIECLAIYLNCKWSIGNGWWSISLNSLTVHLFSLIELLLIFELSKCTSTINHKINKPRCYSGQLDNLVFQNIFPRFFLYYLVMAGGHISKYLDGPFSFLPLFWNWHRNQYVFFLQKRQ